MKYGKNSDGRKNVYGNLRNGEKYLYGKYGTFTFFRNDGKKGKKIIFGDKSHLRSALEHEALTIRNVLK